MPYVPLLAAKKRPGTMLGEGSPVAETEAQVAEELEEEKAS
jgi:hypothetical protein